MREDHLNTALYLATKYGFKIFPAIWNLKQRRHQGLAKWATESSSEVSVIRAWAAIHPDSAYFCVDLARSGYTVLDLDNKNGKNGSSTLATHELLYGDLPDTLTVETPSKGRHYYFAGSTKIGANKLGEGLDTVVMVPIPGADIPGKGVYWPLTKLDNIAALPKWVSDIAGKEQDAKDENRDESLIALDQPHNIERAKRYLAQAPEAVEGKGGNDTTYKVVCAVRDYAISELLCFDLVAAIYNKTRCQPPWSNAELKGIVRNAFKYGRSTPGVQDPTQDFSPVTPSNLIQFSSYNELTQALIIPRWTVKRYIEHETTTVFYGDSGSLKSFLAIDIGLHIAAGTPWLGNKVADGSVYYICGEGHGSIRRRLLAWKQHHQIPAAIPFYITPHAVQLDINTKLLIQSIQAHNCNKPPALIIIDTLATNFGSGDENATKDMSAFLDKVNRGLRTVLKCSVLIIHHTGHNEKTRPRGAYALMAGVDSFYHIERQPDGMMCLHTPGKMKDGAPPQELWFHPEVVKLGIDEDLESISSLVLNNVANYAPPPELDGRSGDAQQVVMQVMGEAGGQNVGIVDARLAFKRKWVMFGRSYKACNYARAVEALLARGFLRQDGETLSVLPGACFDVPAEARADEFETLEAEEELDAKEV